DDRRTRPPVRMMRGGWYDLRAQLCRAASRSRSNEDRLGLDVGFRLARVPADAPDLIQGGEADAEENPGADPDSPPGREGDRWVGMLWGGALFLVAVALLLLILQRTGSRY